MSQGPRIVPVTPSAGGPRRASLITVAIVVALGLAVVKPWSIVEPGSPNGATVTSPHVPASTSAIPGERSANPSTSPGDPNAMACLAADTEQLVTVERSAGREVRSWIAVSDIAASGPLDRRLPTLSIFSSHVVGLGICAPRSVSGGSSPVAGRTAPGFGSGATLIDVQALTEAAGVATAVDLGRPSLIPGPLNSLDPALLYGPLLPAGAPIGSPVSGSTAPGGASIRTPPPSPSSAQPPGMPLWPAGSYAIAFRFPSDDPTVVRWLRFELLTGAGGGA